MLIIESNLIELTNQYSVCDPTLVENFSLKIKLGRKYYEPQQSESHIIYGLTPDLTKLYTEKSINQNLTIKPSESVLACSSDIYKIPKDHFGLVQTKGTLARLFVQATCNDGQVEPGFHGFITLEITNLSKWAIDLPIESEVAQLFLLKCSTNSMTGYAGRYSHPAKNGPTIPIFN